MKINSASMASGELLRKHMEKRVAQEEDFVSRFGKDFAQTGRSFEVNRAEQKVIDDWLALLRPRILALQGRKDEPYYGTIGGGLSYNFSPTGIGTILMVKESTTGEELNVTEALNWFFFD